MSKDWFEQSLRDKYPESAPDFDLNMAWKSLEARRQEKRRKPLFFIWTVLAGIILLSGLGLMAAKQYDNQSPALETVDPIAQRQNLPAVTPAQNISESNAVYSSPQENSPATSNKPAYDAGKAVEKIELPENEQQQGHTASFNAKNTLYQYPRSQANSLEKPTIQTIPAENPNLATVAILSALEAPAIPLFSTTRANKLPVRATEATALADKRRKKRRSKEPNWWLGAAAFYGINTASRTGDAEYLDLRKTEETTLDVFQAGLDFRRRLTGNLFLQSGIYLSQWTDVRKFSFQEAYTVVDSNYLISQIILADGSVQNVYGPADIIHIRNHTEEAYNRYRHIELPLLAGYSQPLGNQWKIDLAAGPVFGLLSTRSGSILTDANTRSALDDAPYRNSGTLSGMARIEWLYHTEKWAAGVGLMGRTSFNSWSTSNPVFTEKRSAVGAGLVFRYGL